MEGTVYELSGSRYRYIFECTNICMCVYVCLYVCGLVYIYIYVHILCKHACRYIYMYQQTLTRFLIAASPNLALIVSYLNDS